MAFCSSCGSQLGENDVFCPNCGAKLNNEVSSYTQSAASPNGRAFERRKEKESILNVYNYFAQKEAKYNKYDELSEKLNEVSAGPRKAGLVWGIILTALFGYLSLMIILGGIADSSNFTFFVFTIPPLIVGIILISSYARKKRKMAKETETISEEVNNLYDELYNHYKAYNGDPMIGFEFSNPAIVRSLASMIESGRADNTKEAINCLLDDNHRSFVEMQAAITANAANRTANNTGATLGLVAASFFFG